MKTWSRESTPTPIAFPSTHLLGSGLGQNGSTSNVGASTIGCCDSSARCPTANVTMATTQDDARRSFRLFMILNEFRRYQISR